MKQRTYRIELTEHQLRLMAQCVEDCHRFIAGQMDLHNATSYLDNQRELYCRLCDLQPLVTPYLDFGSSYSWDGSTCPNMRQRKFIAETYYLYREIYHQIELNKQDADYLNVYRAGTLKCPLSGKPIKVELINKQTTLKTINNEKD